MLAKRRPRAQLSSHTGSLGLRRANHTQAHSGWRSEKALTGSFPSSTLVFFKGGGLKESTASLTRASLQEACQVSLILINVHVTKLPRWRKDRTLSLWLTFNNSLPCGDLPGGK